MKALQDKSAELIENGTVGIVIGYKLTLNGLVIPCFVEKSSQAKQLIYTPDCKYNLAVYLHKPEIKELKKIGIIANTPTLRTIIQLYSEHQLSHIELTIMTVSPDSELIVFNNLQEIESYVQSHAPIYPTEDSELLAQIHSMTREERWKFWTAQFSACIRCYACRAVCPLCYCANCTVECNQPQWIKVSSHTSGNMAWHTMRAMHLAGRCVDCGECGRTCPVNIPVHLLTAHMNHDIEVEFGSRPGYSLTNEYVLNSFNVDDKETFIK